MELDRKDSYSSTLNDESIQSVKDRLFFSVINGRASEMSPREAIESGVTSLLI